MKCNDKTIAPHQGLIIGKLVKQFAQMSQSGYRSYIFRICGGPENHNYYDLEANKDAEEKYKGVPEGADVEALCWINGRYWGKGDKVFLGLSLMHLEEVSKTAVPAEEEEDDLSCFDDVLDFDPLS